MKPASKLSQQSVQSDALLQNKPQQNDQEQDIKYYEIISTPINILCPYILWVFFFIGMYSTKK